MNKRTRRRNIKQALARYHRAVRQIMRRLHIPWRDAQKIYRAGLTVLGYKRRPKRFPVKKIIEASIPRAPYEHEAVVVYADLITLCSNWDRLVDLETDNPLLVITADFVPPFSVSVKMDKDWQQRILEFGFAGNAEFSAYDRHPEYDPSKKETPRIWRIEEYLGFAWSNTYIRVIWPIPRDWASDESHRLSLVE